MADYARAPRRKYCPFCKDKVEFIDYKDAQTLRPLHHRSRQDQVSSCDGCLHSAPA